MSTPQTSPLILVGVFGAAHGVRGEIRLKSFTEDPAAIADYAPLSDEQGRRVFAIKTMRHVKDDIFVARIEGVNDRNAAEALTNLRLFVPRDRLPAAEEGEYYHHDLIGLDAVTQDGERIGTVAGVENFGAGDILEIEAMQGGETMLVPFNDDFVPEVDLAGRRVVVVPPVMIEGEKPESE